MHSRIAHLSKNMPVEYPMAADDFLDEFVGWIADYTDDLNETILQDEIETFSTYFKSYSDKVSQTGNVITFHKGFKEDFANCCIKEINKIANSLTVDKFLSYAVNYELEPWLGDQFGLYIYESGWGLQKQVQFMKDLQEETPYYINNIIDYHY